MPPPCVPPSAKFVEGVVHWPVSHITSGDGDSWQRQQYKPSQCHPPYSSDMRPCDYNLIAKMKEPLWGTHYNTREGIICAVGRSLLDINRSGRVDGVRSLPQIWKKVVHREGRLYWRNVCLPQVIKSFHDYGSIATTFYSTLVVNIIGVSLWSTIELS
jgi:hypothetical protein